MSYMLADGVQEGRQIFVNLKRSIQYVLTSGVLVSGHGSNVRLSAGTPYRIQRQKSYHSSSTSSYLFRYPFLLF